MKKQMTAQEMAAELIYRYETQALAAKACGLSQPTFSLIVNGKLKDTKHSTIQKLQNGLKKLGVKYG